MKDEVQTAFNELRNAIWMLVIPLVMGIITLVGYVQWSIQDQEWEKKFKNTLGVIQEVDTSECLQPRPVGEGHICAQSTDWWSLVESTDCEGGQCYHLSYLIEMEESYYPILIPGLLPLIFLFVVIRKITKARRALKVALNTQDAPDPV